MTRSQINNKIKSRVKSIERLHDEILELRRQDALLSDKKQQFVEQEEDVLTSGRPKVYEKKLVGRIYWKEKFVDHDDPKHPVFINRNQIVRINGEWV